MLVGLEFCSIASIKKEKKKVKKKKKENCFVTLPVALGSACTQMLCLWALKKVKASGRYQYKLIHNETKVVGTTDTA